MPRKHSDRVPDQATRLREAAARCFARQGFRSTTVDAIVAEAGLSRPILYKHFEGKEGLIDAVLDELLREWEAQAGDPRAHACASDALRERIQGSVRFARERPLLRAIFAQDPRVLMSGHAALFERSHAVLRDQLEEILRWGQERGEFAGDLDATRVTELVELLTHALSRRALLENGGDDGALLDACVSVLLRGLAVQPGPVAEVAHG